MNIAKKAMHGVAWIALINIMVRAIRFLITIVLARLLTPDDFGLVAIGLLVINTIALFRDLGMGAALIYQKEDVEKAANTAFTLFPAVGLVLTIIAYISSPYAAWFFDEAQAEPVIKYLSITLFLVCLGITPSSLLDKELEFKKHVIPEATSILSYGSISIILAFAGFGVYSIVYGKIASLIVWVLVLWIVTPYKPKLEFDVKAAKQLLGYGRHVLGATIIMFALINLDKAVIGKMMGTTALGYYTIAYTVSNMHVLNISSMVHRVLFPTFSKMSDTPDNLFRLYTKTIRYVTTITAPISFGIMVVSTLIIQVAMGDKWMPAKLALQILCIAGIATAANTSTNTLLKAIGHPETVVKLSLLQLILFTILIYPAGKFYGIAGASVAMTLPAIIFCIVGFQYAAKKTGRHTMDILPSFTTPLTASIVMTVAVVAAKSMVELTGMIGLIAYILIGVLSYLAATIVLNRQVFSEFKKDWETLRT